MEIRDTKNRKQLAVGKRKCEKGGALGAQGRKQEACNKHNRGSSVQLRNTEEEGVHAVRRAKGGEKKRREADDGRYTKSFCEKALEKAVRSVRFGKTERRWGRTKYTVHSAVHSGSALSKASEWSTGENGEFGNTRGVKDGRWRCPPLPPANEGGMDRSQGRWRAHRAWQAGAHTRRVAIAFRRPEEKSMQETGGEHGQQVRADSKKKENMGMGVINMAA
jgi:hypothetical protein